MKKSSLVLLSLLILSVVAVTAMTLPTANAKNHAGPVPFPPDLIPHPTSKKSTIPNTPLG